MARTAVQKLKPPVAHESTPPTTRQAGTKESPILLLSDDEVGVDGSIHSPIEANAAPQKRYLAMGYKPDRGLGPSLRGNIRPLPIELRKLRSGVGYRSTSVSRSPSPAPRKAPVKIIRPPKESIASASAIGQPTKKATSLTDPPPKAKAQKSAPKPTPSNPLSGPSKQPPPTQPPTVVSPPPPPPIPIVPPDLYISLMSGFAMANMPQAMRVAAAADPMAAFQLAQMCFPPPPPFPVPPFSLLPPRPEHSPVQLQLHTPKLPPKPMCSNTKPNPKSTPAIPPASSPVPLEDNPKPTPTTTSDLPSVTIEMDPLVLKQKRQARKNNIGWIPEPGFPYRGTFDLVPTMHYVHWPSSSDDDVTPPDPQRSLVMEDLPCNCRTLEFVRSWTDQFPATAVYLNGGGRALIEFPSKEVAKVAYDSPRLCGGPFERAKHVRVFWYRSRVEDVVPSSSITTDGSPGATGGVKDAPVDATSIDSAMAFEEPVPMTIDNPIHGVEMAETEEKAQLKDKRSSLPLPELDSPHVDSPMRSSTAPTCTPRLVSPALVTPSVKCDQEEQGKRSKQLDRAAEGSQEGPEHTPLRPPTPPSPSVPPTLPIKVVSPHLHTPRERTPTGSPPSLRYPSSTPEMADGKSRVPSPSEETPAHDTPSPTPTSDPLVGDSSLEQQLRMRLLAMKQTRTMGKISERSSSTSTSSTFIDPDSDTLSTAASPQSTSESRASSCIAISESLELLATSFITDTIQAAQGLPSEPDRVDVAIKERLSKKRGSSDAFGSSADIAFKRQRLAQQIEESKRIMERWKAAKTKEERNQIYALWEESIRSVELLSKPAATPFQWPCYAEGYLIVDSDDEDDMDLA